MNNDPNNVNNNVTDNNVTNNNDVNKNVHPTSASVKDLHGINTEAFAKNDGPRIDTASSSNNTSINPSAFNAVHKQEVETLVEDKSASPFIRVLLFVFLIGLCLFVIFLPDISKFITDYKNRQNIVNITTGELRCSMSKTTKNFDITYATNVNFKEEKTKALTYIETTRGDANKDKEELEELNNKCEKLTYIAAGVEGIDVTCQFTSEKMIETQKIDYQTVSDKDLTTVYTEAGGVKPEFELDENIDEVQKNLQASGYKCKRIK